MKKDCAGKQARKSEDKKTMAKNPALLPDELTDKNPGTPADLAPGDTGHITFTELIVNADRTCFINVKAQLRDSGTSTIGVRKEGDGSFHVVVSSDIKYTPGKVRGLTGSELQPVASVTVGPNSLRSARNAS